VFTYGFGADGAPARNAAASWSTPVVLQFGSAADAARISAFTSGPDGTEVLAVVGGELRRQYWTPEEGFVDAGSMWSDVRSCSAPVETSADAACLIVDGGGAPKLLRAPLRTYPKLDWQASDLPVPQAAAVALAVDPIGRLIAAVGTGDEAQVWRESPDGWHRLGRIFGSWTDLAVVGHVDLQLLGLDAFGLVQHTSENDGYWPPPEAVWTEMTAAALAATASSRDGRRVDVVISGPHGLWHGFAQRGEDGRLRHWSEPERLRLRHGAEESEPVGE
jgi:hypothetical protein